MKLKMLQNAGPYVAGDEIEVSDETALALCDGHKAMLLLEYNKMDAVRKDPANLTLKEMAELGLKNVAAPEHPDHAVYAATEAAALAGKPVASGEPITTTGGVTPPSMVFPAMAEAQGHEVSKVDDVKPKKVEPKKADKK